MSPVLHVTFPVTFCSAWLFLLGTKKSLPCH